MIETRMSCFLEPLDELLLIIRARSPLMRGAAGSDFYSAWSGVFSGADLPLGARDRELLLSFGASLGNTDLAGQKALCRETTERLRASLDEAREDKKRFSRLGAALPVFAGAAIIIMFV